MPKQPAPTSIVERLREQEIEKCLQDLKASFERPRTTNLKAAQAAPLLHTPDPTTIRHTIAQCPLPATWRLWDIATYHQLTPAEQSIIVKTRSISLRRSLGLVSLQWEIAPDDGSLAPMLPAESGQPVWRFQRGSPHHVHAERRIDKHVVHIDAAMAMKSGPGRGYCGSAHLRGWPVCRSGRVRRVLARRWGLLVPRDCADQSAPRDRRASGSTA